MELGIPNNLTQWQRGPARATASSSIQSLQRCLLTQAQERTVHREDTTPSAFHSNPLLTSDSQKKLQPHPISYCFPPPETYGCGN